jgi:hypothetical protein
MTDLHNYSCFKTKTDNFKILLQDRVHFILIVAELGLCGKKIEPNFSSCKNIAKQE